MKERMSILMTESEMDRALSRIAHQILENCRDEKRLALIGIRRRGVPIAKRLSDRIEAFTGRRVPVGVLDITLYRDDLSRISETPTVHGSDIPFPVTDLTVVLADDVIYTGRTARAAMDAVTDMGRPACIRLMALVDRGHRELPIRPDFVGKNVPTKKTERISVRMREVDGEDAVYIVE